MRDKTEDKHLQECEDIENDKSFFEKDCKNYDYLPTIYPSKKRIIVIGDLHGDIKLTIKCLKIANVFRFKNNKIEWIGGDTFVVQIGDQVDGCRPLKYKCSDPNSKKENKTSVYNGKYPEDVLILKFLTALHKEASKQGGAVLSLLGNHEIMNSKGNINYVSYDDLDRSRNMNDEKDIIESRKALFKPGNEMGNYMACTRTSSIIIGSFLFVHAGIVPRFAKQANIKSRDDLYRINCYMRKWLLGLINEENLGEIVKSMNHSMFWHRILGNIPPNVGLDNPMCKKYVGSILKTLKIGNMVIGHTPQSFANNEGINSTCKDSVWRVDTGSSYAFDKFDSGKFDDYRNVQVLEILNDKKINILK